MKNWNLILILFIVSLTTFGAVGLKTTSPKKITVTSPTNRTTTTSTAITAPSSLIAPVIKTATKINPYSSGGLGPVITTPPATVIALQSQNVTISVSATATNTPKYQWSLGGIRIKDATNSTLTIFNVQSTNKGMYSVAVTNLYGGTSLKAYLSVATTDILAVCLSTTNKVNVFWDYNFLLNPQVNSFRIYDGLVSHFYSTTNTFGKVTNATIGNLNANSTYYFMATAKDTNNFESLPSPEITYTVPSGKVTQFSLEIVNLPNNNPRIQAKLCPFQSLVIQYATHVNNPTWSTLTTQTADQWGNVIYDDVDIARGSTRFYRGLAQ